MTEAIRPQPGAQEAFLSTSADIALYGGSAGSGKTRALLMEPLRHINVKGFNATIFRRSYPEIMSPGGLWDEAQTLYRPLGANMVATPAPTATFPSGATVRFAHLQYERSKFDWQGSSLCLLCFDEATHYTFSQFTYMLSRNRSTCGVAPYCRMTTNPDPDSWLRSFIAWWLDEDGFPIPERSGALRYFTIIADEVEWADSPLELLDQFGPDTKPLSFTFIPAKLTDNQILMKADPGYLAKLNALPEYERKQLLDGNWDARMSAGSFFRREWFDIIPVAPEGTRWVRYWDRAATEVSPQNRDPDWTVGALIGKTPKGRYIIGDIVRMRGRPHKVEDTIVKTAERDGRKVRIGLEQEPGASGKMEAEYLARQLAGYLVKIVPKRKGKEEDWAPLSAQAEAGNVDVVRGEWNDALFKELEALGGNPKHDDQGDACAGGFGMLAGSRYTLAHVV